MRRACCVSKARPPAQPAAADGILPAEEGRRAELRTLKRSEICKIGRAAGVEEAQLEEAGDGPEPVEAIIDLVVAAERAAAAGEAGGVAAMRRELVGQKMSTLMRRARELGVGEALVEEAADADDPVAELVELIVDACRDEGQLIAVLAPPANGGGDDVLRAELSSMKPSALRRRAAADGVSEDAIEEAADGGDETSALVQLILSCQTAGGQTTLPTDLRRELSALKMSALRKRAVAQGVDEAEMEAAADGGDEKGILIAALLAQLAPPAAAAYDRPHFGTGKQRAQRSKPKPALRKGLLPANKHAMISYQWDDQDRVIAARETLNRLGVPCWMDIDGGMQQDIYESMAAGVENAACVVCFMSQKYQDSVSTQAPSHHSLTSKGCF